MPAFGHFILHSAVVPPVTAGKYTLRSEQTGLPFTVAPRDTHVNVSSPRFTMPTDQILSSFPPANGEGAYGDRLPQVVLKRRTLPWERNPTGAVAPTADTPWLALVVVAEGEAELSTAAPVADCVTTGTVLRDPDDKDVEQGLYLAVTETVVKKIFPCRQDLALLTHVREVDVNDTELAGGDDDGWLAVVLANRLPVFDKANNKPVRYMACLVNVEGQLDALPPPEPPVEFFEYALAQDWSVLANVGTQGGADPVVLGSKLPKGLTLPGLARPRAARPGVNAPTPAIGAALHGGQSMKVQGTNQQWQQGAQQATQKVKAAARDPDAQRLVRDTMGMGFRYPIGLFALEKVLRFPVLAHWSFTTNEGANFESLMKDLDVGLLGSYPRMPDAGKPPPAPTPEAKVPEVVATGHIGLDHRTRRGDTARAWYRGPCVPLPTARSGVGGTDSAKPLPLAHSADQLRRVIPDGREDLSLAAAFEIGRLLALSQLSVVSALLRFRGEQFGAGRVREILRQVLPFNLPALTNNAGDKYVDMGRFVAVQMIGALARNPDIMIGPTRPLADPGRPLRVRGNLDAVIAQGLGLDLAEVNKRSEKLGVLGALQATDVPLAGKLGQSELDKSGLAALRGALDAELQATLGVAAPQSISRAAHGQRAAAPPDALDVLLRRAATAGDTDDDEEHES